MNLIFDIDGTLWNTTGRVAIAWQKAADDMNIPCKPITGDILKKEFGKTMDVIAADLFPEVTDTKKLDELVTLCSSYESDILDALTEEDLKLIIYPGVVDTLYKLSEKHSLYIVSNCQIGYIELFMRKSGTEPVIKDHLCFGETLTDKGSSIMKLMERNGITAEDTLYIGDTRGDEESSRKAGIRFIHCGYGFGEAENPAYRISSPEELLSLTNLI